jgi:hypothetical protein
MTNHGLYQGVRINSTDVDLIISGALVRSGLSAEIVLVVSVVSVTVIPVAITTSTIVISVTTISVGAVPVAIISVVVQVTELVIVSRQGAGGSRVLVNLLTGQGLKKSICINLIGVSRLGGRNLVEHFEELQVVE